MKAAKFVVLFITAVLCSEEETGDMWKNWDYDIKVCGKSLVPVKPYTDESILADLGEFPWMVNVGPRFKDTWACGGFLVSDRHVVTSATCIASWNSFKRKMEVQIGDLNVDPDVDDGADPSLHEVEKFILHDDYSASLLVNDIGILKLKNKVQFSDKIGPICLPFSGLVDGYPQLPQMVGEKVKVAGWGTTEEGGDYSYHLREVNLEVNSLDECKKNMSFANNRIDDRVMCASGVEEDACKGFSGSPLMYFSKGNWFAMGITSYGNGCAREGYPGVYTNIEHFSQWIFEAIQNDH